MTSTYEPEPEYYQPCLEAAPPPQPQEEGEDDARRPRNDG